MSLVVLPLAAGLACLAGCSRDDPAIAGETSHGGAAGLEESEIVGRNFDPPDGLVDVTCQGHALRAWPYTGNDFSGVEQDPINLVFVGPVDPVRIRSALMSLDGDRSGYGFPDLPVFSATWSDALGNVQTGYVEGDEWSGAVIQLSLGDYAPMRFHLRLIGCGKEFGSGEGWTLGAAHFEIAIPGTAEHQVLSWELARDLVAKDLARSGLLDPASPMMPTAVINATPSFGEIPPPIYNGVPDGLKLLCKLPPGPTSTPVPIPNDGIATILHLAASAAVVEDIRQETRTIVYGLVVPKPVCSDGPLDYIRLDGPVNLLKSVRVDPSGRYEYKSSIYGHLTAIHVDVTQNPPVPVGEPFLVIVSDEQGGLLDGDQNRVTFDINRLAPQERGVEKEMTTLHVSSNGESLFRSRSECLGPDN
jgi:hypothetical protein